MGKSENSGCFQKKKKKKKKKILIAAFDLKVGRCRQLIEFMKICEYLGQGHF